MPTYKEQIKQVADNLKKTPDWQAINPESVVRMQLQNRFRSGLDIARYTADIMRRDMARYDADPGQYTQSLGAWHGFIAQQHMMAIKKHYGDLDRRYIYLSGWMVAALRSEFGPLPDQSMHEKTAVSDLIEEIYTFLKQADARELRHIFTTLDAAQAAGEDTADILSAIDNFKTHVRPIIADIDAGFGNEEATYLLAKRMIEAGACAIQIENQVSDAKQCGHQAGKVTVPHEDFVSKINAVRYAFLELGVDQGVIVARTDSLGASLTQKVPVSLTPNDLSSRYCDFLDAAPVHDVNELVDGDITIHQKGKLCIPKRLGNGLYAFRQDTGFDRTVMDCIINLEHGADLLWIETERPNLEQIASLCHAVRKVRPDAKLVYNNSPSFNWTLKFREQVYLEWQAAGKDVSQYPQPGVDRKGLMDARWDDTELSIEADLLIQQFQQESAKKAGIFHHLITLPTYHTAALSADTLAEGYFGKKGMLAYVHDVQRQEIRRELASVQHQDLAGSNVGDDHKEYFLGEKALLAGGAANTMHQF